MIQTHTHCDFNLTLLDDIVAEPGACAVTYTVGGLSILIAIAGVYSENLPIICIAGCANPNDYGTNYILHRTIGLPDFDQEICCSSPSLVITYPGMDFCFNVSDVFVLFFVIW